MRWHGLVWRSFRFASRDVVRAPNALTNFGNWELIKSAAHVAAGIAILQAPGKNQIQGRPRNHAQLAKPRYRSRQPPIRNGCAHPALNDRRKKSAYCRIAHDETRGAKAHYFRDARLSLSEFCNRFRFLSFKERGDIPFRS